jgi:hypothetical protein
MVSRPGSPAHRAMLAWVTRTLLLIGVGAGILMQVRAGEWLPPTHSLSQYANGAGSAEFVVALLALGLAAVTTAGLVPRDARGVGAGRASRVDSVAGVLLAVAGAGFVFAALVSAPAVGEQDPLNDALHQAGAITGTFGLSIGGLLLALRHRKSRFGRPLLAIALLGTVALSLLSLANFDIDLTGLGRREAWALHQSVSLVCMVLMLALLPSVLLGTGSADSKGTHAPR